MSTTSSSPRKRRTTASSRQAAVLRRRPADRRVRREGRARRSSPTSTATTACRCGTPRAGAPTRPSRTASGTGTSSRRPSGPPGPRAGVRHAPGGADDRPRSRSTLRPTSPATPSPRRGPRSARASAAGPGSSPRPTGRRATACSSSRAGTASSASTRRARRPRSRSRRPSSTRCGRASPIERPDRYPVTACKDQQASLGVPAVVARDPPLLRGRDARGELREPAPRRGQGAVRPSTPRSSVTFEAVPEGGGLAEYYEATRRRLGDNFQVTEPRLLPGRLRGHHADRDPGRGLVREALLLRAGRPRLLAQLRGARGHLPPGLALGRLHRLDAPLRRRGGSGEVNATLARLGERPRPPPARPRPPRGRGGARGPGGGLHGAVRRRRRVGDDGRPGPGLPAARPSPPTTSTASCPRPSAAGPSRGPLGRGRVPTGPATASSGCSTPRPTARRPGTASTSPPSSAGSPRRRACAASAAPSSPSPTSTPAGPRTRTPPSASSSAASSLVSRLAVSLAAPPDLEAFPAVAPLARAAQDAGAPLPDQLPLRRDHERLQLQVHVVPGRRSWAAGAAS